MSGDSSWVGQIEQEWAMLVRDDPGLDVERFYRHIISASKSGFVPLESIATAANRLLVSPLPGAALLGRRMLEQTGIEKHPALRLAYALAVIAGTGGDVDLPLGDALLQEVLKSEGDDKSRAIAAAALADSARIGRGREVDFDAAKAHYELAFELGLADAANNLGLYWENRLGGTAPEDTLPDLERAMQWYARGGQKGSARCKARLKVLRG